MKRFVLLLAAFFPLLLAPSAFGAIYGTVDLTLLSDIHGSNVNISTPSGTEYTVAGPYHFAFAHADAASTNPNGTLFETQFAGSKTGFCIDLFHNIYWGQTANFDVKDLSDVMNSTLETDIRKLFAWFIFKGGDPVSPTASVWSDALSVAIWERMNETDTTIPFAVNTGNVTISWTGPAVSIANEWLTTDITPYAGNIYALYNKNGVQGQEVVLATSLAPPPVPEPGTLVIMLGLGLSAGGFGLIRGRRRD
jgi:hypothetical protein